MISSGWCLCRECLVCSYRSSVPVHVALTTLSHCCVAIFETISTTAVVIKCRCCWKNMLSVVCDWLTVYYMGEVDCTLVDVRMWLLYAFTCTSVRITCVCCPLTRRNNLLTVVSCHLCDRSTCCNSLAGCRLCVVIRDYYFTCRYWW